VIEPGLVVALPTLDSALRGALLALLALLGLSRLRTPAPHGPVDRLGLALAAGLCVQVLAQSPSMEAGPSTSWHVPAVGVSMGNSALFWLFARVLCDDDFRPSARHAMLWLAVVAAGAVNVAWLGPWCWSGAAPTWASAISRAVFAVPALFGALGVAAAAWRWRDDLVERRRWLRAFIVAGGSAYTVGMVLARGTTPDGRLTSAMASVDAAVLLVFVAAAAWLLLRPAPVGETGRHRPAVHGLPEVPGAHGRRLPDAEPERAGVSEPAARGPAPEGHGDEGPIIALPASDPADDRLADALDAAMSVDRLYRDPDLSVAGLARRLEVPEYRLRRLINRRLGHRNFSAFLNGHRLAEVRAALADPAKADRPVLTLALEAGFGSIGPFNRAFKAETGLTPTEFRRRHGTGT
jgi:AraC-like DNA-binding protein